MRTKQEIVSFLEGKLGTKVKCIGNPSLDGQCVTLIKALMEFLGVPDPYKARGNAKDCIANYLKEGIAKPGMGFISVFSNKDMAQGVGHIWCNAGEGNGVFYESNGVKPLIVTKGKTYIYDNVCNFDSYIKEDTTSDNIEQLKKDLAEQQQQVRNYVGQVEGLSADIKKKDTLISEITTQLQTANDTTTGYLNEIKIAKETLSTTFDCKPEWAEINAKATEAVGFIDKADELDRKMAIEVKEHQADVISFGKEIESLKTQLASLETKYKELKDTQITPSNVPQKSTIIDIIKKLLGI